MKPRGGCVSLLVGQQTECRLERSFNPNIVYFGGWWTVSDRGSDVPRAVDNSSR